MSGCSSLPSSPSAIRVSRCSSAGRLYDVPIEVEVRIGVGEEIESAVSPIWLNVVPHRSRAVVILKNEVGFSVKVHVAHADNVPTGSRIAKVEARPLPHDLIPSDLQLPDRDEAVVVLKHKILTRSL